jgi:recombination protein RecA
MDPRIKLGRDLQTSATLETSGALGVGLPEIENALPAGGLPHGQVVELSLASSSSLGTRLCFGAMKEAQRQAELQGGEAWCAFVDPERSLFAPSIAQAGVELGRLLVVQPGPREISRVAIQLVEARAFAVVVIDLCRVRKEHSTREWARAVRRMALAIEHTKAVVVLLTKAASAHGALSGLPVGMRVQLSRKSRDCLSVAIKKDKLGRVRDPVNVRVSPDASPVTASLVPTVSLMPTVVATPERRLAKASAPVARAATLRSQRSSTQGSSTQRSSGNHPRKVRHRLAGFVESEPQLLLLGGA